MGGILRNLQRFPEAATALRKALELDPFQASLHADLGDVFLAVGQLAPAEARFRSALDLNPGFALAHRGLGDVLADRGAAAEAGKAYLRAIELDPSDASSHVHLADLYREQLREPGKAAAHCRQALELDPDQAGAHSGLAVLAAMPGDFAEAERLLRRAAELDPQSAGIRGNLAEVLRRQDRLDEAILEFRRAIQLDPTNTRNLNNLAIPHANRREFAEAERLYSAVLERRSGPDRIGTLLNLAQLCGELNRPAEAEAFLREALALGPENPATCHALARFLASQGTQFDEALDLARRAVQGQPGNPAFLDALGWVQFQRGDLDAARATLKAALEQAGDQPVASGILEHLQAAEKKARQPQ